jgi:Glycosyltransferase Family 4
MNAALRIRRLFGAEKPDIVHTFFETSNTWGGLITKLSFGPLLVSSRPDMGVLRSTKHQLAYKLINNVSDGVQAVSGEVKRMCTEKENIRQERVFTVYNGIDIARANRADGSLAVNTRFDLGGDPTSLPLSRNSDRSRGSIHSSRRQTSCTVNFSPRFS